MRRAGQGVGQGRHVLCAVLLACLLALLGLAGGTWRAWRWQRRGMETAPSAFAGQLYGVNVSLDQYGSDELPGVLDDVAQLGFGFVRQRFPWRSIESQEGAYDWATWDAIVRAVVERDIGVVAILDDPPPWALRHDPYPLPCVPPCEVDAYARFVAAFAERYRDSIDHYQVWDEPNLSRTWGGGHAAPCGYAVLLEAAYVSIHDADPRAYVLGGGLAPTQAPGPGDLNDLAYLRQLYAQGAGDHLDLLAVKPYGFWSGPEDRRVGLDVLNYSRVVAARELVRGRGDGEKKAWAVEWGWNALPDGWVGDPPPWGTDSPRVQGARIAGAVSRALTEWPWTEAMCWAQYQPDLPATDPGWGFALRDPGGEPTPLYDVLRIVNHSSYTVSDARLWRAPRWLALLSLLLVGCGVACVLWVRLRCWVKTRQAWQGWLALHPAYHVGALAALALLYALTPRIEWMAVSLALMGAMLYVYPGWVLLGAVWSIPLFYAAKAIGPLYVSPSETLLYLAAVITAVRLVRAGAGPWSLDIRRRAALDVSWALWLGWGTVSAVGAPDPALAWHEWRLCILAPALLYVLLRLWLGAAPLGPLLPRLAGLRKDRPIALAWVLSGLAVSAVAVVQWVTGMRVPAGHVGRVTGVYYSPNHLALYLVRVWPVSLAVALCSGWRGWLRRAAWAATALLGTALYLTYSRGAWLLAVPVVLVVVGWCYRRQLRWWMAVLCLVALLLVTSNVLYGRLATGTQEVDELRIPVWQSALEMVADHPWRGVRLDGFRTIYQRYMRVEAWTEPLLYHPHNVWLDAAVRTGLPGLVLFVGLVVLSVRAAVVAGREEMRALAVGCLASLLAGLAHGMVDSGYFLADLAWCLALVGAVCVARESQSGGPNARLPDRGSSGSPLRSEEPGDPRAEASVDGKVWV